MKNTFKLKKRRIYVFVLLLLNQFLFNLNAANSKKLYASSTFEKSLNKKNNNDFKTLLSEKKANLSQTSKKEEEQLDKFKREVLRINNLNDFEDQINQFPEKNTYYKQLDKEKKDLFIQKGNTNTKNEQLIKRIELKKRVLNSLPLPTKSKISTSQFEVPSRGYVNLKGPKVSLNLNSADTLETLKFLGKLGNYGIVIIEDNDSKEGKSLNESKITANFDEEDIDVIFNSILLSSKLQAVVDNNIIFIGKNILNKSIKPKVSKTYRLNQVNAASVADYLSTLGAEISKVMLVSGSIDGIEIGDSFVNKKEFKDDLKDSYGLEGGPLFGLIGTADLRLQTITLIGTKDLIETAEKYIRSLDIRHRQVALTIKIIDVSLTNTDLKQNIFELKTGETEVTSNSGLGVKTGNFSLGVDSNLPNINANVPNIFSGGLASGQFFNWLEAKITNEKAKVLASPTLILGANPNILSSGAAVAAEGLDTATIGRPFKNEGFIKVGETVVTGFKQTSNEGVVTCTSEEDTAGITFGAKVDKIDDNGYVTFALSPAISSVTKTVEIAGCGIQNTLSVRKLDTGSIRVKNGDTLILTGVLTDEDNVNTIKVPILGNIPILGNLFKKNSIQKRKSELIILVTPRILKDK